MLRVLMNLCIICVKAAYHLHINNLNFEYFGAEDESGGSYGMDFNLVEICKLIK